MRSVALAVLIGLPIAVFAQDGKYTIHGKLGSYNAPAKVYLEYGESGKIIKDSTVVKNGEFKFTGKIKAPVNAYLLFNEKGSGLNNSRDNRPFYLEQGTIDVTGTGLIASAKVEGTKTNRENEQYEAALKPINDAYAALEAKQKTATEEQKSSAEFDKENKQAEKAIELKEAAANKVFIQENPDSYVSLTALEMYAYVSDYADIAPLYESLSPAVKQSEAGKQFAARLPKLKAVAIGAMAPVFTEADTIGKMVSLASFKGKYVLVDFWASWCGPCRHENPNVVKVFNRYKNKNFTIIGVSLDKPGAKDKWLKAIHADGLTWTQLSDLKFWKSKTAEMYGVRGIPQNFLIDPDGKIIAKNLRGDDLEDKLAELLGKS